MSASRARKDGTAAQVMLLAAFRAQIDQSGGVAEEG